MKIEKSDNRVTSATCGKSDSLHDGCLNFRGIFLTAVAYPCRPPTRLSRDKSGESP